MSETATSGHDCPRCSRTEISWYCPTCGYEGDPVPGGAVAPSPRRVQDALRDALTVFADTAWAREYHDLWNPVSEVEHGK